VPQAGNPQALNRYAYVRNNPLKYNDPTGHCPICLIPLAGAAVGAITDLSVQYFVEQRPLNKIDLAQTAGAAAGGAVFATSVAILAPVSVAVVGTGVVGVTLTTIGVGTISGIAAGRADDFVHASVEEIWKGVTGEGLSKERWISSMIKYGIISDAPADAFSGMISMGAGTVLQRGLYEAGLINSPEVNAAINRLDRSLPESWIRYHPAMKSWMIETNVRRFNLSQADMDRLIDWSRQGLYERISDFLSTLTGVKAKEDFESLPNLEGL